MMKSLLAIILLFIALPASAQQAPAKAQKQGACQPGPVGRKYENFASCYAINIQGGLRPGPASTFCHKLCSQ
jgi:hypothetical protein